MLLLKLKVHVTASFSPGHDIDKRQRKISRAAPFMHGSHPQGCGRSFPPQCVRQKQNNGRQRTFVRKKKFVRENLKRIIFECLNILCSSSSCAC